MTGRPASPQVVPGSPHADLIARKDAPGSSAAMAAADDRNTVDVTDASMGRPEHITLLAHTARTLQPPTAPAQDAAPIEERMSQMPRLAPKATTPVDQAAPAPRATHHPTGGYWIAPTQRQLLGRPPA